MADQTSFLNRISIRRNQVVSVDPIHDSHDQELEDLEHFQKHVADRFLDLLTPPEDYPSDPFLSIAWIRKLLNVFLCCEAEFKAVVLMGPDPSQITKPPLDRLVPEFLDRVVKALDICNTVTSGVESVRHFQKLAEIAVAALEQRPIGEGQVRRAKKALNSLITAMAIEDKDGQTNKAAERTWSFGRRTGVSAPNKDRAAGEFRALSWGMSRGWSAAKQIQAMSANMVAPRGNETSSLVQPVYIMSTIMLFVMWILVTAVPCQERTGLLTHFPVPRNLAWAQPLIGLQDKIAEEWKKKEKKCGAGLLEEMQKMEKLGQSLIEFADNFHHPAAAKKLEEVAAQVAELAEICKRMEEGLVPLQQQIRELFHRAVRSRTEVLEVLEQGSKATPPMM